jgi:hypothetical protein
VPPLVATAARSAPRRLDYRTVADLRYQLRRFLRVREVAARRAGVQLQQYPCCCRSRGWRDGGAHDGALAERLQIRRHAAGETFLQRLARKSLAELTAEGPQLVVSLQRLIGSATHGRTSSPMGTRKARG